MEKPSLMIEFAIPCFDGHYHPRRSSHEVLYRSIFLRLKEITDACRDRVDLTLVPFERPFDCMLRSGRYGGLSNDGFIDCVRQFNEAGYSFMAPFNGGLTYPSAAGENNIDLNDRFFEPDRSLLADMAESSARTGVQNYVTVARDDVRDFVRQLFPNLKITASCIKFIGGHDSVFKGIDEYNDAFASYDLVCPTNQHVTPDFLSGFRAHVDKMVLLLTSTCGSRDMSRCYGHYVESQSPNFNLAYNFGRILPDRDFAAIHNPSFPYPELYDPRGCGSKAEVPLYCRPDDLNALIRMGVNKFKLPNSTDCEPLDPDFLIGFISDFIFEREQACMVESRV